MSMTPAPGVTRPVPHEDAILARSVPADRHAFWEHCRNSLGIARLLAQEGRATELVDTACYLAVESACRAALFPAHPAYDGDPARALERLAAPRGLWPLPNTEAAIGSVRAAEQVISWISEYLRRAAPDRAWRY